ncbi:MAG TPA: hypothetical protein V6C72_12035, partial [Chroococcales cyanobacterium]
MKEIQLRDVQESDLPAFFKMQSDPVANLMAAFTAKDPTDRDAFTAHWAKLLRDETVVKMAIVVDGVVVGNICSFELRGER